MKKPRITKPRPSKKRRLDHASPPTHRAPRPSDSADRRPGQVEASGAEKTDAIEPDGTPSSATAARRRDFPASPDVDYAREREAYHQRKPELLRDKPGEFVVFVGDEMVGPFLTFREARIEGYRVFGPGAVYVKQLLDDEPAAQSGATSPPCRS